MAMVVQIIKKTDNDSVTDADDLDECLSTATSLTVDVNVCAENQKNVATYQKYIRTRSKQEEHLAV